MKKSKNSQISWKLMFPAKLVFSMWNQRKKSPYLIRTLVFLSFFFLPPQNFQSVNIVFHFFPPGLSDIVIKGGSVFSFLYCRVLKYSSSITQLLSKSNHGRMRARQRGGEKTQVNDISWKQSCTIPSRMFPLFFLMFFNSAFMFKL